MTHKTHNFSILLWTFHVAHLLPLYHTGLWRWTGNPPNFPFFVGEPISAHVFEGWAQSGSIVRHTLRNSPGQRRHQPGPHLCICRRFKQLHKQAPPACCLSTSALFALTPHAHGSTSPVCSSFYAGAISLTRVQPGPRHLPQAASPRAQISPGKARQGRQQGDGGEG